MKRIQWYCLWHPSLLRLYDDTGRVEIRYDCDQEDASHAAVFNALITEW